MSKRTFDHLRVRGFLRVTHVRGEDLPDPSKPLAPAALEELCKAGRAHRNQDPVENLVVDVGKDGIAKMIGHGQNFPSVGGFGVTDVSDLQPATMRVGNANSPPTPDPSDTDISVVPATYTIQFVSVFYPAAATVTLAGVIPQGESSLDGVSITEEGVFLQNGAMLARVTFAPEVKIPSHAIQFEHSIVVG